MFSRIFCRNTNIPTQNPVEPQVQVGEIPDPIEIQSSGGQRWDHVNNPTKIQWFSQVVVKGNSPISQRMLLYLYIVDLK